MIRIVPAQIFLDNFASDRSHMLCQPDIKHPTWPVIRGSKADNNMNLFQFIDMKNTSDEDIYGKVYSLSDFIKWSKS